MTELAGPALLVGVLVAGAVSVAANHWPHAKAPRVAHVAFLASWACLAGALTRLLAGFLLPELSLEYVWAHTHVDYPWYYRLSGLWAGAKGTVLLWAFLIATFLLVAKRRVPAGDADAARLHRGVHTVLLLVVLAFTWLLVTLDAFARTPAEALALPAERNGRGLQPLLVSPFMVIHPPVQFVAYALTAIPGALALSALATGTPVRAWATPALKWARWAWLFATLGLGLGALWAYYVLSFGGYWAWDPVENANLLPWLALTAFLHAGKHAARFGEYRLAAPFLAFAGLWLTAFASFVTRSGWWVSVHAFTDPTSRFNPDALARLLSIIDAHAPTRLFTGALLALLFAGAALLVTRYAESAGRAGPGFARAYAGAAAVLGGVGLVAPDVLLGAAFEAGRVLASGHAATGFGALTFLLLGAPPLALYVLQPEPDAADAPADWSRRLMYAGVITLTIALVVTFLLNLQFVNAFNRAVFDQRAPLVAAPILTVLTLMLAHGVIGRKPAVALAAGALLAGVAGAVIFPDQWAVAAAVPVAGATGVAAALKIAHANRGGARPLRVAGGLLLAASLLGHVMWSNPPTRLPLGFATVETFLWEGALLFALSTVGLLGAVAAFRGVAPRLAVAGAAAATLAAGYGVGALLGVAALALVLRHRDAFAASGFRAHAPSALRQTGIWLVHLAVALGVLGVAASTYAAADATYMELPIGEAAAFPGGHVVLGDAEGTSRAFTVPVTLTRGDRVVEADVGFTYQDTRSPHYAQDLRVTRGLTEDLYPAGFGLVFADGEHVRTLDPTTPRDPATITGVTFELTALPLMSLVWAGLWLMLTGVGMILAAGAVAPAGAKEIEKEARPREV